MELAEIISLAERRVGGRQADLSRRIDVTQSTVSRWKSGQATPDFASCLALADITGIPPQRILELAGHDPKRLDVVRGALNATADTTPHNPRLASFLAHIEAAFHALTEQEWQVREDAGRALFIVPPVHATTHPSRSATTSRARGSKHSNQEDGGPHGSIPTAYPRLRDLVAASASAS